MTTSNTTRTIKRINIGMAVRTIADNDDDRVYGTIKGYTDTHATIEIAGTALISDIERSELEKATKDEIEAVIAEAVAQQQEDEDEDDGKSGSTFRRLVIRTKAEQYQIYLSLSGKKSLDNGDQVALLLRGKTLDEVYSLTAEHLLTTVEELKERYKHLNAGQQRMNLGNRLRKIVRDLEKQAEAK